MKKLIFVFMIIFFISLTTGCSRTKQNDDALRKYFYVKEESKSLGTLNSDVTIIVDKRSGVNYYWINSGYGKTLAPMYNNDGTLVIDEVK